MEFSYSFRANAFARKRQYRLGPDALHWTDGVSHGRVGYDDVQEVRLFRKYIRGEAAINKKVMWRVHLYRRSSRVVVLSSLHYVRFGRWEDRSMFYNAFINALLAHLRKFNANLTIVAEDHWTTRSRRAFKRWATSIGGAILVRLLKGVRHWNPDRTTDAAGGLMQIAGPLLRGHRVARANLATAFPEKSSREIDSILRGMWDNFGRATAEYAYLDGLWDYDPENPTAKRIIIDAVTADRMSKLRNSGRPVLFFGAHLGNWELPTMAAAFGLNSAMVYRSPDSSSAAHELAQLRTKAFGLLIPAGPRAALQIRKALRRGLNVGMLVDRHRVDGIDVTFFGRTCKVNPTLARFARQFNCPIYGSRAIRISGSRFRVELTAALKAPLDSGGKIDVAGTMQMITSTIECWVREHPEQWLWMHRRWG
jgi:Kdo2-lipid IVA lauroyltransferase/acyltransferase